MAQARIAALRVFSSARQMSAELVASAHKTVHISLPRDGAHDGAAILIERAFAKLAPATSPLIAALAHLRNALVGAALIKL
jgi:hypothetical protein